MVGRPEQTRTGLLVRCVPLTCYFNRSESTGSAGENSSGSAVPASIERSSEEGPARPTEDRLKDWQSQAHVRWDCKFHVVFVPKYRRKKLFGRNRAELGRILRELCRQKEIGLVEGKAMPDHVHLLLSIPPKYSVAMTVGYLKGKSAVKFHREVLRTKGTMFGRSFWARGYCVSTVGLDEAQIRSYIRNQERLEKASEQQELDLD